MRNHTLAENGYALLTIWLAMRNHMVSMMRNHMVSIAKYALLTIWLAMLIRIAKYGYAYLAMRNHI